MGKLSVLGAQRVKALEGMLDDNLKAELAVLAKERMSFNDANELALQEFGLFEEYKKLEAYSKKINEIAERIQVKTGVTVYYKPEYSSYRSYPEYMDFQNKRSTIQDEGYTKKSNALKEEYKKKKQMLWLCETLEEAKEIVGI